MSEEKDIISKKIVDGIEITQYSDGHTTFVPVEDKKNDTVKEEPKKIDDRKWYQKISDWWDSLWITPYIKIRDFADPFQDRDDFDVGSDGKQSIEAGIRIRF